MACCDQLLLSLLQLLLLSSLAIEADAGMMGGMGGMPGGMGGMRGHMVRAGLVNFLSLSSCNQLFLFLKSHISFADAHGSCLRVWQWRK